MPREGPGVGRGGSAGADVTTLGQYMLIGPGFRPQLVGTIVADGPGAMETIRIMRIELLHTDLYTGPATEIGVITPAARSRAYRLSRRCWSG